VCRCAERYKPNGHFDGLPPNKHTPLLGVSRTKREIPNQKSVILLAGYLSSLESQTMNLVESVINSW